MKPLVYGSVCSGIEAKDCLRCAATKPLESFGRKASGRDGRASWCLECAREDSRAHYAQSRDRRLAQTKARRLADPEAHRANRRRQKLGRLYGLTVERHSEMVEAQGRRCAICAEERPLKFDHCHASGKVRALLCGPCNTSLGSFRDDPALLDKAAAYLREHSA